MKAGAKQSSDLTRWNRAGLRHFQYINGNAIEYLEILRAQLSERFPRWESVSASRKTQLPGNQEDPQLRKERIQAQYHGEREDWGLEIMRTFARASHILTEHDNAFANEGYLQTATQWDHVRRLVEMLDYHPAPPSSASTLLVLYAKDKQQGEIAKGFQVKHTPPKGGTAVIFETLDDLNVDHRLNQLHLLGWNRSQDDFDPSACDINSPDSPWQVQEKMDLSVGDLAILVKEINPDLESALVIESHVGDQSINTRTVITEAAWPTVIDKLDAKSGVFCLASSLLEFRDQFKKGYTRLLVGAKKVYVAKANGPDMFLLDRVHGLTAGDVVAVQTASTLKFHQVSLTQGNAIQLQDGSRPEPGSSLFQMLRVEASADGVLRIPLGSTETPVHAYYINANSELINASGLFVPEPAEQVDDKPVAQRLTTDGRDETSEVFIMGPSQVLVGRVKEPGRPLSETSSENSYLFAGDPGSLKSGDWILAEGMNTQHKKLRQAWKIEKLETFEDAFHLTASVSGGGEIQTTIEALETDVLMQLKNIAVALDQTALQRITLEELASTEIAQRDVADIQGVGASRAEVSESYTEKLNAAGISSIGDLAECDPQKAIDGISPKLLHKFVSKSKQVCEFTVDGVALELMKTQSVANLISELDAQQSMRINSGGSIQAGQDTKIVSLNRIYGPFQQTIYPNAFDRNDNKLITDALIVDIDSLPETLKPGRTLLIEKQNASGFSGARQVEINKILPGNIIQLLHPLNENDGFTFGNTVIRGNVSVAGHGEFKGEKVLGSGNATQQNQTFLLNVDEISFVADSTMPSGVRADILVMIDGQIWQQVSSLRESRSTDPHYTVRMTETGHLRIGFGDGQTRGRRLPTGKNNIRVAYRVGVGLSGNVSQGGLEKALKPHRLIEKIRQPLPANGGNDMEAVVSLRDNAPASLLALERAVSLQDFANLAVSQSSVWQAHALSKIATLSRQQGVEIIVIPAGGAELDKVSLKPIISPTFIQQQRDFLQAHALPGVAVSVSIFDPVLVNMDIIIRIKTAQFDPQETLQLVKTALIEAFGLSQRKLGQALYRSDLYKVVESVKGVENSDCRLLKQENIEQSRSEQGSSEQIIRHIPATNRQVIYLDAQYSSLKITPEEFKL